MNDETGGQGTLLELADVHIGEGEQFVIHQVGEGSRQG